MFCIVMSMFVAFSSQSRKNEKWIEQGIKMAAESTRYHVQALI